MPLTAQVAPAPNTLSYDSARAAPAASLADVAWLAGNWRGPGLGGVSEELWSRPEAGSMMGMYRLMIDGRVTLYELMAIRPEGESLVLLLKHFHADLRGWEEKDEVRRFRLVKLEDNRVYFEGLTYERVGPDHLRVHLVVAVPGSAPREVEFAYERARRTRISD